MTPEELRSVYNMAHGAHGSHEAALRAVFEAGARKQRERIQGSNDVLFIWPQTMTRREWWSGGTWLYPGQAVLVVDTFLAAPLAKVEG